MAQLAAAFASSHGIMLAARVENWLTGFTAIDAYPENLRVGLMASGGLRHFTVEEAMDLAIVDALRRKDIAWLERLDPRRSKAGSSEIRNWIVIAAAATELDLDWVSYTPAYPTPALTGTGLGFASSITRPA